jgi:imidazolonepropionase-like amidohydrolase
MSPRCIQSKELRMIPNLPRALLQVVLILALTASAGSAAEAQALALVGARVYPSPADAPLDDAVVVASSGAISAIGKRGEVQIPENSRVIDCGGKTVVAGFWNSHVHFTEPAWNNAAGAPVSVLQEHMQEMLTRWGFTTVWDLGSEPIDSLALRRRVDSGEVRGPQILLAGSIFPRGGHPVYLPPDMQLPEAATPEEAAKLADDYARIGSNGVKLFTGVYMGEKPVVNMNTATARAAVDIARAQGKPVFAHPQNKVGVDVALAAGVNVLAHAVPMESGYSSEQLGQFKSQGTALIPTMALWTTVGPSTVTQGLVQSAVNQLRMFSLNGGVVLFGTDVGFTHIYDTSLELELMHHALSEREVLASLTANPALYFKATKKGRVETGFDADLVVLDGDPATDVQSLARVLYTIRAGQIIYQNRAGGMPPNPNAGNAGRP